MYYNCVHKYVADFIVQIKSILLAILNATINSQQTKLIKKAILQGHFISMQEQPPCKRRQLQWSMVCVTVRINVWNMWAWMKCIYSYLILQDFGLWTSNGIMNLQFSALRILALTHWDKKKSVSVVEDKKVSTRNY